MIHITSVSAAQESGCSMISPPLRVLHNCNQDGSWAAFSSGDWTAKEFTPTLTQAVDKSQILTASCWMLTGSFPQLLEVTTFLEAFVEEL